MTTENVLPEVEAPVATAVADDQQHADAANQEGEQQEQKPEDKPEKHPLEKELAKERRRINRIVEQREQARAEAAQARAELERLRSGGLQNTGADDKNSTDDAEILKIPRAELPKLAERLQSEAAQREEVTKAASNMRKALGDDFRRVTDELAEVFSADLQFAVAASEAPAELARYLTDPDNADEAERIARMSPYQAGRALAKIEAKLSAKDDKPQPSKAAAPLTAVRGTGGSVVDKPPTDPKAYMKWANEKYGRA